MVCYSMGKQKKSNHNHDPVLHKNDKGPVDSSRKYGETGKENILQRYTLSVYIGL